MSDSERDLTIEDTNVSDTELSKEERLEAARKKFEELKKKNKKKKSKKSKKSETAEIEESAEGTPVPEDKTEDKKDDEDIENAKETKEEIAEELQTEKEDQLKVSKEAISESLSLTSELEKQIEELKQTVDQQKSTIKKLRDLKLSKMDLNDKILSLEQENKGLKALASSASSVPGASPIVTYKETFKPAKPVFTKNDYASSSQQSFSKSNATEDFREKLMVWKSWQVDMTNWNGSGTTQKVAL